jgi:hypothetical protein
MLDGRESAVQRLTDIGMGTFFWPRPFRDDGIINRGSGRSACKSATRRFAICDTRAPVTAAVSTNNPNSPPYDAVVAKLIGFHISLRVR